ncbi:M16 family metallopeptidase [Pseudomonas sp. EL_65y_Pfl2_R95]|uniref:M16 family metallopeptidase n=1 Tax=Pseudomonas sp. EL_65y_Pfl2_R95 TaxID=3088698 RepID=UPI0030D95278
MAKRFLFSLIAGLWLCTSNTVSAEDYLQAEGYTLENGLQLLLKPTAERQHVSIRLIVGVGFDNFSCVDKELPHLLEHMLFSGINKHDELDLEARMQALGGEWNAYTRDTDTTFVIEAPAKNQRAVLDLLVAALTQSHFTDKKLEAAKKVIEHENGGHYSNLQRLIDQQNLSREANQQLAVELGLACVEKNNVSQLSLQQVKQLQSDWYAPNNMTLIVVGGLDPRLPAYLDRQYGAIAAHDLPQAIELPQVSRKAAPRRELITRIVGENASLHWIFPEPWVGANDYEVWELLSDYIDWKLYEKLRIERNLSYGPSSERNVFGSTSFFSLNGTLERGDLDAAEQALRELVDQLKKQGLDEKTFLRLQAAAVAKQDWGVQGNSAIADYYWGSLADYENGRFSDPGKRLKKVTFEQANKALKQLLEPQGYIRIEKPLLTANGLYFSLAVIAGLLLLAFFVGRLSKRSR